MTTTSRWLSTRRSLLALGVGLIAFAGLSILRIRMQYALLPPAALGFILTLLMYLVPGALVALLVPRFRLMHGAVLGLLTTFVVWFEVPLRPTLVSWSAIAQSLMLFAFLGVVVCLVGSAAATWMIRLRDL
jgi:hypothetical protein